MDDLKNKLSQAETWLSGEYSGIRTGLAAPALLDSVKVDSYGTKVPINQVGTIGIENARTLRVSVWQSDTISALEQAILDADLGVSVSTDSSGLRVSFPELTSERREQLIKLAKQKLEEARMRVRGARDEAVRVVDKDEKDGKISEDERFTKKDAIQKQVDECNKKLESLFNQKEKEINN